MVSAFHQLCPRDSGSLTLTAPTAIRLWEAFTLYLLVRCAPTKQYPCSYHYAFVLLVLDMRKYAYSVLSVSFVIPVINILEFFGKVLKTILISVDLVHYKDLE